MNYRRVCEVLLNFKISSNEMTEAPTFLLECISDYGVTKDSKIQLALKEIRKS